MELQAAPDETSSGDFFERQAAYGDVMGAYYTQVVQPLADAAMPDLVAASQVATRRGFDGVENGMGSFLNEMQSLRSAYPTARAGMADSGTSTMDFERSAASVKNELRAAMKDAKGDDLRALQMGYQRILNISGALDSKELGRKVRLS